MPRATKVTDFGAWWDASGATLDAVCRLLKITPAFAMNLRAGRKTPSLRLATVIEKKTGVAATSWSAKPRARK